MIHSFLSNFFYILSFVISTVFLHMFVTYSLISLVRFCSHPFLTLPSQSRNILSYPTLSYLILSHTPLLSSSPPFPSLIPYPPIMITLFCLILLEYILLCMAGCHLRLEVSVYYLVIMAVLYARNNLRIY